MADAHSFAFRGEHLLALPSGALLWPARDLLCVSDLHLGKSERQARRGGVMLPPYEARATLDALAQDLAASRAGVVVCLGDSFDDLAAAAALEPADRDRLAALMEGRRWIWVEGNHDPGPVPFGGERAAELSLGPLAFRHEARPGAPGDVRGEVSGHWHPKAGLPGWAERRPCFVIDAARILMPAYGAYTGGLDARRPPIRDLFGARAVAVLTGRRAVPIPLDAALLRRRV